MKVLKKMLALAEAGAVGAEPCRRSSAEPKGHLHRIQKTMRNTKMMKIQKYRSLQLQALGRQCWMLELVLEAVEETVKTEEDMEIEQVEESEEMEVAVEEEEAMDVDVPSGGQARARHALPAGREGLLPPGWGWGEWSPLQGTCARCPRALLVVNIFVSC
ncbi:uncharacterized protein LOC128916627 [Rissa tridactyla]|uniref:uncharacterized protein LOC128916627 n=1 Tax=Rissa tridactyla TaxID=75485 RepID=UPI0023BA494E|nr:uncharacterized protein LOC128916627 [Rissa tridactyla]